LVLLILFWSACKHQESKNNIPVIAQVHDKKLYQPELDEVISNTLSPKDSTQKANTYIDRWVRESLIMHEAEKSLSKDLDLNQLVEDYKSSLLLFHYEKKLIEEKLDTVVSLKLIEDYYESYAEEFTLAEPIIRARFAKISSEQTDLKAFTEAWKKSDEEFMTEYCQQHATIAMIDTTSWLKISEVTQLFPPQELSGNPIRRGRNYQITLDGYEYFLKIEDFRDKNEIPPLAYIKDQIIKIILHRRKTDILHEIENSLLDKETNNNNVKLFIR
jgi:hypothetical protein